MAKNLRKFSIGTTISRPRNQTLPPDVGEIIEKHKIWLAGDKKNGKKANFKKVNLNNLTIIDADLRKANFKDITLTNTTFINSDMTNSEFTNSTLNSIKFSNCILERSSFFASTLTDVDYKEAKLAFSNFEYANMKNVDFFKANLENVNMNNITPKEINLKYANLKFGMFYNVPFDQINLDGVNLFGTYGAEDYLDDFTSSLRNNNIKLENENKNLREENFSLREENTKKLVNSFEEIKNSYRNEEMGWLALIFVLICIFAGIYFYLFDLNKILNPEFSIPLGLFLFSMFYFFIFQYSKTKHLRIESMNKIATAKGYLGLLAMNEDESRINIFLDSIAQVLFTKTRSFREKILPIDEITKLISLGSKKGITEDDIKSIVKAIMDKEN